jgi:hypothetical protein
MSALTEILWTMAKPPQTGCLEGFVTLLTIAVKADIKKA